MTFCALIKEQFPDIHVTVGGNTVTRFRDVLPDTTKLFALFDSAIVYEGETALLRLVEGIANGTERCCDWSKVLQMERSSRMYRI
jgi:hypothetical protein